MKISEVNFHMKPIPSHPWWECKNGDFVMGLKDKSINNWEKELENQQFTNSNLKSNFSSI